MFLCSLKTVITGVSVNSFVWSQILIKGSCNVATLINETLQRFWGSLTWVNQNSGYAKHCADRQHVVCKSQTKQ